MQENPSFSESQRFNQKWLWVLLIGIMIVPQIAIFCSARQSPKLGTIEGASFITPVVISVLFLVIRLRTRIDAAGIQYQFFPFYSARRSWDDISSVSVREYSPIAEYGGWGIRMSFGNGMAFNIRGNKGIQIILKSGKKILIGTQLPEQAEKVLHSLGKSNQ